MTVHARHARKADRLPCDVLVLSRVTCVAPVRIFCVCTAAPARRADLAGIVGALLELARRTGCANGHASFRRALSCITLLATVLECLVRIRVSRAVVALCHAVRATVLAGDAGQADGLTRLSLVPPCRTCRAGGTVGGIGEVTGRALCALIRACSISKGAWNAREAVGLPCHILKIALRARVACRGAYVRLEATDGAALADRHIGARVGKSELAGFAQGTCAGPSAAVLARLALHAVQRFVMEQPVAAVILNEGVGWACWAGGGSCLVGVPSRRTCVTIISRVMERGVSTVVWKTCSCGAEVTGRRTVCVCGIPSRSACGAVLQRVVEAGVGAGVGEEGAAGRPSSRGGYKVGGPSL